MKRLFRTVITIDARPARKNSLCALTALAITLLLFTATHAQESSAEPVRSAAKNSTPDNSSWTVFRGNPQSTGVAHTDDRPRPTGDAPSALPTQLELLWTHKVPNGAFEATAVIANDTVYLGDLDGTFFALDLKSGEPRWKVTGEAGYMSAAGIHDSRVYVGDYDGLFLCFDAKSGEELWTFQAEAEINGGPTFHQGRVLFGSQDARLYCLDAKTGELVWKHEIGDQIRCFPTIVDGQVFLAGCDGWLHIIDATTGKAVDKIEIGSPTGSTPAALGKRVYFGTEGAEFLGVDLDKKKVLWRYRARRSGHGFRSSAAVNKGAVVFGGQDRRVHAVDPKKGESLWTFATKGMVNSSPVIVGERVFVGSKDGRLYEINLKTGKKTWDYHAGGRFSASPAVAANRLIIASEDGQVYCFGEKPKTE